MEHIISIILLVTIIILIACMIIAFILGALKMGVYALVAFLTIYFIMSIATRTEYTVQLTFCDKRPPVTITVTHSEEPSTHDIHTYGYQYSVPEYEGYLNVCSIKVLNKK